MRSPHAFWSAALVALILAAGWALTAFAAPPLQEFIPTPTVYPVTDVPYTVDTVGGADWAEQIVLFDAPEGVTIGSTRVTSLPPDGMVIRASISVDSGSISEASVLVRYPFGFRERYKAGYDEEADEWVATLGADGGTLPIWASFAIGWQVVDDGGTKLETDWQPVVYADPSREWQHSENEIVELFWFGFGEDDADAIARDLAEQVVANAPLRAAAFGGPLDAKPRRVIVPDHTAWAELDGRDLEFLETLNGALYDRQGVSIRVLNARTTEMIVDIYDDCGLLDTVPDPASADRAVLLASSLEDTRRALAQTQQSAVIGSGSVGPNWWALGQAAYFAQVTPLYDIEQRLSRLATQQALPPLSNGDLTVEIAQADGCPFLGQDVGWSFVNWFAGTYGLDAHAQVVAQMADGATLYAAIEQVTGLTFFDVENEWRAYIGFKQLALADIDPAAALEPFEDSMLAVGDTVTLPAAPPIINLSVDPGPKSIQRGTCFAGTPVEILDIGALDGVPYYQIDCMGLTGWVTRDVLVGQ